MNPPTGIGTHSLAVSLLICLLFGVLTTFVYFLKGRTLDRWRLSIPLTNAERKLGWSNLRFTTSRLYQQWRNPMRQLRRSFGWPSSRQWRKLRRVFRSFLRPTSTTSTAGALA